MNIQAIAQRSLVNCHAVGLDSIILDDTPGKMVRVFIANENHALWKNSAVCQEKLSVAVHSHHCDIVLDPIFGSIYNVIDDERGNPARLRPYLYQSAIAQGSGSFRLLLPDRPRLVFTLFNARLNHEWPMEASRQHTVFVPRGERAAWFVRESTEDASYDATCYSNDQLENFDFSPLYKPMPIEILEKHLVEIPSAELTVLAGAEGAE